MKSNPKVVRQGFNVLGFFYNPLKRIFLANQPEIVISESISEMAFHSNVLVVGGGSDNTLLELFQNQICNTVTHVDISSVLSEKASIRLREKDPEVMDAVKFIAQPFLGIESVESFDAVIFPFYLDLFLLDEVKENIKKTKSLLLPDSRVYVIDFNSNKNSTLLNRLKIKGLYLLFYPFTRIYRKSVPDYDSVFSDLGFTKVKEQKFFKELYQLKVFKEA